MTKEMAKAISREILELHRKKSEDSVDVVYKFGRRSGIFYILKVLGATYEYILNENREIIGIIVDGQKVTIEDLEEKEV